MASVNFRDWFPFPVIPDQYATGVANTYFSKIKLPLASLSKAYWLAKSYDWSVDVAWSGVQPSGFVPTPGGSFDLSGTISGTGTVNIETPAPIAPAARAPNQYRPTQTARPGGLTWAYTVDAYGGQPPFTFRSQENQLSGNNFSWFNDMGVLPLTSPVSMLGGDYFSSAFISIQASSGNASFGLTAYQPPSGYFYPLYYVNTTTPVYYLLNTEFSFLSAIDCRIVVDGVESDPIPLYANCVPQTFSSFTDSGTIRYNFNNFYS